MRIRLYGKDRLWFWIPTLLFVIFFGIENIVDIGFNFGCTSVLLLIAGVCIWRIVVICKQPNISSTQYWAMQKYQDAIREGKNVCPICGSINLGDATTCYACHVNFHDYYNKRNGSQ